MRERLLQPVDGSLPWALRWRAYALLVALCFASVPFLHLYLPIPLSGRETLVHAIDIAIGPALVAALFETAGRMAFGGRDWRLRGSRALLALAGLLLLMLGFLLAGAVRDALPGTETIRAKHQSAGYGDMALRVLPVSALLGWLVYAGVRHSSLARELAAVRELNRELRARADSAQAPKESSGEQASLALESEGGELWVLASSVLRVQAQENYCEYVLTPDASEGPDRSLRRPLVRTTLAAALAELPDERFLMTHRSHLVNLDHVRELRREGRYSALVLGWGEEVPISRSRQEAVRERVRSFLQTTTRT